MLKFLVEITKYKMRNIQSKKYEKFMDLIRPPTGSKIPITQQ